jgi:hypothetical protein
MTRLYVNILFGASNDAFSDSVAEGATAQTKEGYRSKF